jgi:hypothetical protein
MLNLAKEAFNPVALLVQVSVVFSRLFTVGTGGGMTTSIPFANSVSTRALPIISLVGGHSLNVNA